MEGGCGMLGGSKQHMRLLSYPRGGLLFVDWTPNVFGPDVSLASSVNGRPKASLRPIFTMGVFYKRLS